MNKRIGTIILSILLMSTFFVSQVFAETLGDRLVRVVCWNLTTGGAYTLSNTENSSWNGQLIQGLQEQKNGQQTVSAKFLKQSSNDNSAVCELRTTYAGSSIVCNQLPVTKSGQTLTVGGRQACSSVPLF